MAVAEVLTVLGTVAAEAFAKKLAEKTAEAFLDEIIRLCNVSLTSRERDRVVQLLDEAGGTWFDSMVAQFKFTDRNGIMFIGPSGSGKTTLMGALSKKAVPNQTTSVIDSRFVLLAGRITALHDTPGQIKFWTRMEEALRNEQPHILVLVLADGYLDNVVTGDTLYHPDLQRSFRNVGNFLKETRRLEDRWVQDVANGLQLARKSVKYCVLFVNKMELWYPSPSPHYLSADFQQNLNKLASIVSRTGTTFITAHGSANYDNFKKKRNPNVSFSHHDSLASVRALKALLVGLLLEGKLT
jgi:GTPase SAR1 family protein